MKKLLVFGVMVLLFGLALAPSINANISKTYFESKSDIIEDDELNESISPLIEAIPLKEEFLRFKGSTTYLHNLQNKLLTIFENDRSLYRFTQNKPTNDCGCYEQNSTLAWNFPIICMLLFPFFASILYLYLGSRGMYGSFLLQWISMIGKPLNCFWFMGLVFDYPPLTCVALHYLMLGVMVIWILTIGNLNLLLHMIFPDFQGILIGWNLINFILKIGLELNCPTF